MRLDNGSSDRETHARPLDGSLAPPSIELLEYQRLLEVVNPGAVICNTYPDISACTFRCHLHRSTRRGILDGVFQQVANDFGDALPIDSHARKIRGDFHFDFAIV